MLHLPIFVHYRRLLVPLLVQDLRGMPASAPCGSALEPAEISSLIHTTTGPTVFNSALLSPGSQGFRTILHRSVSAIVFSTWRCLHEFGPEARTVQSSLIIFIKPTFA